MANSRYLCTAITLLVAFTTLATCALAQCFAGPHDAYVVGDCPGGYCIPNPANYGYYQTGWRRWPTLTPDSPHLEQPGAGPIESLPAAELPDPRFEAEITPPQAGAASPRAPAQPALPPMDPMTPPRIDDPSNTLPRIELPAPTNEPDDSGYLPANERSFGSRIQHPRSQDDRLVALPVQQNPQTPPAFEAAIHSPRILPARLAVRDAPSSDNQRVHRMLLSPQRQAEARPPATSLSLGRPSVLPSQTTTGRVVQTRRTVAPVSWQNPFRADSSAAPPDADPAPAPTSSASLTPRAPAEPRRIELPELISPLPPVDRSVASDTPQPDATRKQNPVRAPSGSSSVSPASHRSIASGNPLRSGALRADGQISRSTNPLRRLDAFNPVRDATGARGEESFSNPLRNQ